MLCRPGRGEPARRSGALSSRARRAREASEVEGSPGLRALAKGGGVSGLGGIRRPPEASLTAGSILCAFGPRSGMGPRPAKTPAVKGRWTGLSIDPLAHGSSTCETPYETSTNRRAGGMGPRCTRRLTELEAALWPAAIGAGFVRLASGRALSTCGRPRARGPGGPSASGCGAPPVAPG